MCHRNRAEEITGLCNGKKFVKLNSWTIYDNAPWNWARKIETKQVSNICPMEIFFPSHKWVSLFKPEQATLIKPLRNFRSSRRVLPYHSQQPVSSLQCIKRKDNFSSSVFPTNQIMHPGKDFLCSFLFLILRTSPYFSVSLHNISFWKYPLHFNWTSRVKNPLWVKTLFSINLAEFLPCW